MKNNVLFVTEKWADGNPNFGFTHTMTDIFNTFSQTKRNYNFNTLHIDEAGVVFGKHVDDILPRYCLSWDIKIVIVSLLGNSPMNPSLECFQKLKQLGIFICFLWCDSNPNDLALINYLRPITDINVFMDASYIPERKYEENDLVLWTPLDSNLFYPDDKTREVSFVGRLYPYREASMSMLSEVYPKAIVKSGQREHRLSFEEYAQITRESQIIVNFSYHPLGYHQVKGRVFEATASNCLLLESDNPATEKLFIPNKEYVPFISPKDLLDKVNYYLENEEERLKIAQSGHEAYQQRFNITIFWNKIMSRAESYLNND